MSNILEDLKDKPVRLSSSVYFGEESPEGKSYILFDEKVFQLEGSSLEILQIIKDSAGSNFSVIKSKIDETFESPDFEKVNQFLDFCISKKIIEADS